MWKTNYAPVWLSGTGLSKDMHQFYLKFMVITKDAGPVPQDFTVPLHKPTPCLSPDFHDPLENTILDYRVLTKADFGIATPRSPLPNLGPNMHSPEALIAAIDHFGVFHNVTAAGSQPLTPYDAHQLPVDPE